MAAILLLVTLAPVVRNMAEEAAGTRALIAALVRRAEGGDLPLGPGTPPAWALARSGSASAQPAPNLARAIALLSAGDAEGRRLGIALATAGREQEAVPVLEQARQAQPEDPFVTLALANILDAQGYRGEARTLWQSIDMVRPLSFQLHREGARLANEGQRARGEAMLQLAIEIDPTYPDPYHTLGGFYWGVDNDLSAEMYRKSLALDGLEPFFAFLAEGKLALLDNRPLDAVPSLQEAVRLRRDHGEANQFLGTALRQAGRSDEAIPFLEEAADLLPQSPWPLIQLGYLYLDRLDYQEAVNALAAAIDRRTAMPLAFDLLAQAYAGMGRAQQAAAALEQAAGLQPDVAGYHIRLGDLYASLQEVDRAITSYRTALELDPGNRYVRSRLDALGVAP